MFLLFVILLIISCAIGQPCDDNVSVDISNGTKLSDGTFVNDGVTYPPQFVYTKTIGGELRYFGCVCRIKNCIIKCCSLGSVMYNRACTEMQEYDKIFKYGVNISYMDEVKRNVIAETNEEFQLIELVRRPCPQVYKELNKWFVQKDGNLFIELSNNIPPYTLREPDKYCIDTFVSEDANGVKEANVDALVCFADESGGHHYAVSSTCMLISCVFILATCGVYAWLPELRNLHGRVLMAYLLCMFVAFSFMATMQILLPLNVITISYCLAMTFIIYFSLESGFFWLNVMCFDIWWTFSGKRGITFEKLSTKARFYAYALYAFGIPTALTILLAALEFSNLPLHPLLPQLRQQGCFIHGNARLIYLYGPLVILCIANLIFFVLTALKIAQIKKQTSVLKSKESSTHDSQRNDKQRLSLYIKLFVVMGISWLLEVISAIYPELDDFWIFTDGYNVLLGLIIFIIFVCKRKIFRLIKKR
ncbi:probable G-protein coupled receptor Mth-like 3 isoform X4 [Achroia grisella]|nr:probable G-protein coupled receptor Mth-like 3 isoform X4 [Achroia grisella]